MSGTEAVAEGGRGELAGLRRQLDALAGEVQKAQCALRREEALGRIHDRLITLWRLEEVPEKLEAVWVEELRALGIPINRVSLQFPSSSEGYFTTYQDAFLSEGKCINRRLADYPWVGEAWASGRSVFVNRQRLEQAGFLPEECSLVEVPLPGGGSLGVNSLREDAFDGEAVQILRQVAGLLSLGIERLKEIEALRNAEETQRIELAVQRVRNQILQMESEEDWGQVVRVLDGELRQVVGFHQCGVNLIDLEQGSARYYVMSERGMYQEVEGRIHPVFRKAMEMGKSLYRPRRSDPLFSPTILPEVNSVVDAPFAGGTVAINSTREDAFSSRDIQLLERFAQVMSEAHRRLGDLKKLQAERAYRQKIFQLDLALQRVRNEILLMEREKDWGKMVVCFWGELKRLLEFDQCGVTLVDLQQERFFAYKVDEGEVVQKDWVYALPLSLKQAMETGKSVYRRNREEMERYEDDLDRLVDRCSIVDVPFLGGTFAINSAREDAFSAQDIEILERFAQVLSEGYRRLEDLKNLQAERAQKEEFLQFDLALQRMRNEILLMEREKDWEKVALQFWKELRQVLNFNQCGINLVDLQRNSTRYYTVTESEIFAETVGGVDPVLRKALATGESVYRPRRTDPLFAQTMRPEVNSVVDVPFPGGTVAVNSREEDAFSARDIQILERFAQVMSEAHRRLEDLRSLAFQEEHLHQAQKLEAVGQLATGVAHEINNPLTAVLGYSELLLRRELDPEVREHLETIHQEGERAREIAARLLQFVHRQKASAQLVSLNLLAEEVLALVRQQFERDHVQLVPVLAPDLPLVQGQGGQLQQLLLALLQNSREAIQRTGKGGAIEVQTRQQGGGVRLEVADDGPGIPEPLRERIFEPFFTTKEVGKGTGMGLSLCFAIAQEHGGRLWAEPCQTGACLVLELPAWSGAGALPQAESNRAS